MATVPAIVPKKYANADWVGALVKQKKAAQNRAKNALELAHSPAVAMKQGALTIGGAGLAGYLDVKFTGFELRGKTIRPSMAGGFGLFLAGLATGRREAIDVGAGMLAPHAYKAGADFAIGNTTSSEG